MSNKKEEQFNELLREAITSEDGPELTDSAVDQLLMMPITSNPSSVQRMKRNFVRKALLNAYPEPVRDISHQWPFGRWIETMRNAVRLTRAEVAIALGKEEDYIQQIENGNKYPWHFSAADIADLIDLFRLHIKAVSTLIEYTVIASRRRPARISTRSKNNESIPVPRSIESITESYASRGLENNLDREIATWLEAIRTDLKQRNADDLLQ